MRYTAGFSQQKIADLFGVGQTAISKIVLRQTWKEL
jgi:predicted transcriptional regulator